MEKEKEKILKSSQEMKEEEHSDKMLTQWEKELKMLEDWLRNPETEEDYQKDAVMKSGEEFQPEEQLDEVGLVPTQRDDRRAEKNWQRENLSEEMVEQQLSNIVVEVESAVEWQENATGDEVNMGDQNDLSFDLCEEEEMQQQSRLHERSQPVTSWTRR
jgi:hypothetical protein